MSNYTKTTNFLAKDSLPDADTAKIIRGSEFDTEFNSLVVAVASKANTLSPTLTGIPTAPTAASGTNTLQIASTAFVQTAATAAFPSGGIIMWSGSIATIPIGWLICDGLNSTPNLKNRFVLGAGDTYAVAATGGSADAVVVSHTHTATSTVTDPGHLHTSANQAPGNTAADGAGYAKALNGSTGTSTTGITVATTNATTGVSGTNANLPPYYALAYIMKS
tara:strand:+ start:591 stop:1253 length:663 start_codon:yes stop_codon:yes gene_type:complete